MATAQISSLYGSPLQGDVNINYLVNILENTDHADLQTEVNTFLTVLLPALVNNAFVIQDIKYSSAQLANNTVSYSALILYVTYG